MQTWAAEIEDSSRASLYRLFANFDVAFYLNHITIKKFRVALAKLRLSSHNLEVESGR